MDLIEKQVHPNLRLYPGGPPIPPYDLAGWTLPMQMGVKVDRIEAAFSAIAAQVKDLADLPPGGIRGKVGFGYVLSRKENGHIRVINIGYCKQAKKYMW